MKRPWLLPLVPFYAAGSALRQAWIRPQSLAWPVVSVGNLSAGGTGKTPFTIALARLLAAGGFHVDVLSRGYGRAGTAAERVDPGGSAERYGDEPLLIANEAGIPVYVSGRRWEAGKLAEAERAESVPGIHLLDDGFQHWHLARQVDIVLVDTTDLADSLLPAGNLREGITALRRAAVLAVESGPEEEAVVARLHSAGLGPEQGQAIWRYRRRMVLPPDSVAWKPAIAFCGIGRPEQFFAGLEGMGIELTAQRAFPDHHRYTMAELDSLRRLAAASGARVLITTAKDFYRLGGLAAAGEIPVLVAGLKIEFEDEAGVGAWLRSKLERAGKREIEL